VRSTATHRRQVFGFRTFDPRVLHSHYMAVDPRVAAQRARHRSSSVASAEWCVDNEVTRCAGRTTRCSSPTRTSTCTSSAAFGVAYHVDHYGALGGINGSLPSDRLTVQWDLRDGPPSLRARDSPSTCRRPRPTTSRRRTTPRSRTLARARRAGRAHGDGWKVIDVDRDGRRYLLARG
jgi:predicted GNAT superfamily acetyltransferase